MMLNERYQINGVITPESEKRYAMKAAARGFYGFVEELFFNPRDTERNAKGYYLH